MSIESNRLSGWLSTHPWFARFAGFEVLVLAIAFLSLVLLGNDFGGLFYAMSVSVAGLAAITVVLVQISRYVRLSA
ncbi:hypothetical protein [Haladaptatus sp. NG-WS-4]